MNLRFFEYHLPFIKPFTIASKSFEYRQGIFLVLEHEGIHAYAEIAPLPGFSKETLNQVKVVLLQNKNHLESLIQQEQEEEILNVLDSIHQFPSLSFGLDTLIADYQAKKKGITISEHFFGTAVQTVESNVTIGIQKDYNSLLEKVGKEIQRGFKTVKMKVGVDFTIESEALELLREHYPDLNLRIDANQAWSVKEAISNLHSLNALNIEYCEQPVNKEDLEGLKKVSAESEIPIAADEAVSDKTTALTLIEENICDLLVIKPALFGRIKDLIVTKEKANTHSMEVIITTSLDANIGRTMSAVLASGLGSKKYAHGLATGSMFKDNKNNEFELKNGSYVLSSDPGIGRTVDLTSFEEVY